MPMAAVYERVGKLNNIYMSYEGYIGIQNYAWERNHFRKLSKNY